MLRLVLLLLALGLTACEKKKAEAYGPGWPSTVVGTLAQKDVEIVASKIGKLHFPARKEDLMAFFPPELTPDNVAIYEIMLHKADEAGRNGGRIEDYWLNQNYVVRVGIAYYEEGIKVEWAVVLKAKELATYKRFPYPALEKEENQRPQQQRP